MALSPGIRLGPYEILSAIGAGGTGEVYRARDTRLDRSVAIKILPAGIGGADRLERFQREARAISRLTHPHICTLFDVGEQDGVDFLVMEYLAGETLAQRLPRGRRPASQVRNVSSATPRAARRAFRLGEAESRPDFPQDRGALCHRSRRCHRSAADRKRMEGDENPGLMPLQNGRETAKSISVGRFRPVAVSGAIVAEFSNTHS